MSHESIAKRVASLNVLVIMVDEIKMVGYVKVVTTKKGIKQMNDKIAGKFKDSIGSALDKADKDCDEILTDAARQIALDLGDGFGISKKEHVGLNISPITQPKVKSILVATPMYGGMCTGHYTIALMNSINILKGLQVETLLASLMNESLIPRARNELVRLFLNETQCSHIMFIDADMYFNDQAIATLYKADKGVACGIYPKKELDWDKVSTAANKGKADLPNHSSSFVLNLPHGVKKVEPDADGMVEVRHGGTGFMLIKREVFEKLAPHVPEYRASTKQNEKGEFVRPLTKQFFDTSIDETGCLLSEDYHFCALWRKYGGKVYASTKLKFNHIGTHIFGGSIE